MSIQSPVWIVLFFKYPLMHSYWDVVSPFLLGLPHYRCTDITYILYTNVNHYPSWMGLSENRVPQKNNGFWWFMTVHTYFYLLKKKTFARYAWFSVPRETTWTRLGAHWGPSLSVSVGFISIIIMNTVITLYDYMLYIYNIYIIHIYNIHNIYNMHI